MTRSSTSAWCSSCSKGFYYTVEFVDIRGGRKYIDCSQCGEEVCLGRA